MDLDSILGAEESATTATAVKPKAGDSLSDPAAVYIDVPTGDIYILNPHGKFEGMNGTGFDYVEGIEKRGLKPAYDSSTDEAVEQVTAEADALGVKDQLYARWRKEGIEDLNWYQVSTSWEWLTGVKNMRGVKSYAENCKDKPLDEVFKDESEKPHHQISAAEVGRRSAEHMQRVKDERETGFQTATINDKPVLEPDKAPRKVEPEIVHESPATVPQRSAVEDITEDAAQEAADALGCSRDEALTFSVKDMASSEWFKARVMFWQAAVDTTIRMAVIIVKAAVSKRNRLLAAYGPQHRHFLLNAKTEDGKDLLERFSRGEKKGQLKAKNHRTLAGGTYFKKSGGVYRADTHELGSELARHQVWEEAIALAAKAKQFGINVEVKPALKFWNAEAKKRAAENDAIAERNAAKPANESKEPFKPLPAGYVVAPFDETRFMTIGEEKGWTLKQALDPLREVNKIKDVPIAGFVSWEEDGDDDGED